jgi:hypothetical protein
MKNMPFVNFVSERHHTVEKDDVGDGKTADLSGIL